MSVLDKNFLMRKDSMRVPNLHWNAVRSALVADVLRASGPLRQSLRFEVHGESMLPTLWPGDIVRIESCSLEDVPPSGIVLAFRDDRLFLHRLVASKPNGFLLRGDSVPRPDPQYPREALLGRLVHETGEKRGSFPSMFSRAAGLLLCHFAPARRLALKLHSRRRASARPFQSVAPLQPETE
jgi:hypothetical protein